jgi:hypothetical protein
MNVVKSPATLAAEGQAILARARREMSETLNPRTRRQIEARACQRVENLLTLAETPDLLRDAAWERRRGRHVPVSRYRAELS